MTAAEIVGLTLLHFLWQGGAVALTMQLVLPGAGRSSAAVRYGIACAALMAMVALPAITSARLAGGAAMTRVGVLSFPAAPSVEAGTTAASTTADDQSGSAPGAADSRQRAFLTGVVWIWALGVALLMIRTAAGWWRVRRCTSGRSERRSRGGWRPSRSGRTDWVSGVRRGSSNRRRSTLRQLWDGCDRSSCSRLRRLPL